MRFIILENAHFKCKNSQKGLKQKGDKMANKRGLLGMLAMVLVFGVMVVGCDTGSTGGAVTYRWAGSGLTLWEWNYYVSAGISPDDLINQNFTPAERIQTLIMMEADDGGLSGTGATVSFIRDNLTAVYGAAFANAVVARLEAQGWVVAATTNSLDSYDFADIFIAIRE